jgi:hypothetical protein
VDQGEQISTNEHFEEWLREKPLRWKHDIEVRAALRVLPLVLEIFRGEGEDIPSEQRKQIVLGTFRAAFVAWTAQSLPEPAIPQDRLFAAAVSSANLVTDQWEPYGPASAVAHAANMAVRNAAISISQSLSSEGSVANIAAHAAVLASNLIEKSPSGEIDIWASIDADVKRLWRNETNRLIDQRLWLNEVRREQRFETNFPLWSRLPFDVFDKSTSVSDGNWGVWLAWYRDLLSDTPDQRSQGLFNDKVRLDISRLADDFWSRDADTVVADIAKIAGFRGVKSEPPRPAPQPPEAVEPQSDEPTSNDQLGRRSFAKAMVERLDKVLEKEGRDGFAAHIHAPWGAGKTSILLMMREFMTDESPSASRRGWAVVHFNAWEQQHRNPPWWPLVEEVKQACLKKLSGSADGRQFAVSFIKRVWLDGCRVELQAARLQMQWLWWKLKTDALPYIVLATVFVIVLWVMRHAETGSIINPVYDWALKLFTAALAAFAAFYGASRVAVFGSATNAKFYEDMSQDPLKRIKLLLRRIVEKTNRPVCVFIDDLDRCRADYVVDLLEGIQTSFRNRNVVYVVAADRTWIKASFEMRYSSFTGTVGNAGQPLGYLFLEKIFQLSTPIPGMGEKTRSDYWNRLLKPSAPSQPASGSAGDAAPSDGAKRQFDANVEAERLKLRKDPDQPNITSHDADQVLSSANVTAEVRAAVALELSASPALESEAEHLLGKYKDVVPDNPRVMKRMINAFAIRRAIGVIEQNTIPTEILVRWTILEQRFPALADLLVDHPEWLETLTTTPIDGDAKLPPLLVPFMELESVRGVIGKPEQNPLTSSHIREITRGSSTQ